MRSIIFRREIKQIRDMIERSREIIGDRGRLNENLGIWRDLPGGRRLEFGGVKDETSIYAYRGRAHDLKAYDELTEFTEFQYRFLNGWLRSTIPGQHCRVIAAFNPPTTEGGQWVIRHFAPWLDPNYRGPRALPGELRYFAMVDGKEIEAQGPEPFRHGEELITPRSRTFIPARLEDNPLLLAAGYGVTLEALPEPLRTQLRSGSFTAGRKDHRWAIIPRAWVEAAQARYRARQEPAGLRNTLGVDVARGGEDETVIAARHGVRFEILEVVPGEETPNGPSVVQLVLPHHTDDAAVNVDSIGVGASAYDDLCEVEDLRVNALVASERSEPNATDKSGKLTFYNDRAMWWWRLREQLDPKSGMDLELPDDPALAEELCTPRWEVRSSKILVEDKEAIKARLGRSPNRADALILAHQEAGGLMLW